MSTDLGDTTWRLAHFALGYLAIMAMPGPNMLAVGALSALRGLRGVLPFCLGVATGAGALALALHVAFNLADSWADSWADSQGAGIPLGLAGRAAGAVLLLVLALQAVVTAPPRILPGPAVRNPLSARAALLAITAGFLTGSTNPITATYLAAQFLGPLAEGEVAGLVVLIVPAQAMAWGVLVAALFSRPAIRRAALAHHRAACMASGLALTAMAMAMLRPLFP